MCIGAGLVGWAPAVHAQQGQAITGRVVAGDNQEPVPAASVLVAGTTIGVQTSDSGTFTLHLPADAKQLTVRRIGFLETTVPLVAGQTAYTVTLARDVLRLQAEVVTGVATTVSSQSAANAVAVVNGQDLNAVPAPTVENAMQGLIPGAVIQQNNGGAPGGGMQIQIRGITSINANASPLYVIDGVIVDNDVINPGLNAITNANAVNVEPTSMDEGVNRIADINPDDIESIEVLKGASASAIYGSKASAGVIIITTKHGTAGKPKWEVSQKVGHFSDAATLPIRTFPTLGSAYAWGSAFGYDSSMIAANYAGPQNYQNQLFGNSQASYETDVSVSGTQGPTEYFLSALSKYDNGTLLNTGYNKQSVRSNITEKFSNAISVSTNLFYAHDETRRGLTGNDNNGISPYDVFSYTPQFVNLDRQNADGTWATNPFGPANPFADAVEIQTPETVDRFVGGGTIDWHPYTSEHQTLQVQFIGGVDLMELHDDLYAPPNLQIEQQATSLPGIATTQNADNQYLNYSINIIHHYTGLSFLDATSSIGFVRERRDLDNPTTVSQGLIAGADNPAIGTVQTNYYTRTAQRDQSLYAQEQVITLEQRLALTAGVTGERTTNDGDIDQFYWYPKFSASLRLPTGGASWLDELKLRAAYGQSGTQPLYGVRYTPLTTTLAGGLPGLAPDTVLGDPNVKPETETEIETGIDATMFNSRMQVTATVYQKRITNLLLQAGVDPTEGYTEEWLNGGEFTNQGIELSLSATPVQSRTGLTWITTTSFYRNYSVVNSIPVPGFRVGAGGGGLGSFWIQPGRSISEIVNTNFVNSNGVPVQIGDEQPTFVMSFNNAFTLGAFRLAGVVDWSRGGDVLNITELAYQLGPGLWANQAQAAEKDNVYASGGSPWVESATFVKIRDISLSYTLPHHAYSWISGGRLTSVRVSLDGRNLVNWYGHGYDGLDPETSAFGSSQIARSIDIFPYPPSRSYFFSFDLGL